MTKYNNQVYAGKLFFQYNSAEVSEAPYRMTSNGKHRLKGGGG